MKYFMFIGFLAAFLMAAFLYPQSSKGMDVADTVMDELPQKGEVAVLAGGCFWCLESEFRALNGVLYTTSGYTGGDLENPTYKNITTGKTGHAEATEIYYDPSIISYRDLVDYFLRKAHDPTQLNRQGVDVGTQYRSAIFYADDTQRELAKEAITAAETDKVWKDKIVTKLEPLDEFWPAEEYHQQYYEKYKERTGKDHIRVLYKKQKKALSQ